MKNKLGIVRLFIFGGLVWASLVGPISAVIILMERGASNTQIGFFAAAGAVISMGMQPVWGLISDKIGSPRRVLCVCVFGSGLSFGLLLFTGSFSLTIVFLLVDMFFRCGIPALLDSHIISETKARPGLQYSHIRMAGSLFFGGFSLIFSFIMNTFYVESIIPVSAVIALFTVGFGVFAARGQWEELNKASPDMLVTRAKGNLKRDALALIKNKPYLLLIVFVSLNALAVAPLFMFMIEYVNVVGGVPGNVPLIHALRCAVEIPAFILVGSYAKRTGAKTLMVAGGLFSLAYMIGLFFATTFFWLAISHLAAGAPGFILGLTGRLRLVEELTPASVRSTSITLMGTFEVGLGSILGNLIAGFVLEYYGTRHLSLVSACAMALGIAVLFFIRKPKTADEVPV